MDATGTIAARDGALPAGRPGRAASFAVVVRTYQWDAFIERQVERYRAVSGGGDLFISMDETRGPVGPSGRDDVFGTTDRGLLDLGLANRYGRGSLIWWNNDYPQYAFRRAHPGYDFYVFVEYDSLVRQPIAALVDQVAARGLDMVAEPVRGPLPRWFWWPHTRLVYDAPDIRATLTCISILSGRALDFLFERRLAAGRDPAVRHWPLSEGFVATELARAGFSVAPLSEFGEVDAYDWFPPVLEESLDRLGDRAFVHPVLDPPRYVKSVLKHAPHWRCFFQEHSDVRRRLSRMPRASYVSRLPAASWETFKRHKRERVQGYLLRSGLYPRW